MSTRETDDGMGWAPTRAQAMTDVRGEDDEPPFDDVTVRMTVPASIGGSRVRVELSNLFGEGAVRIARSAIGVCGRFVEGFINRQPSIEIAAGASRWTDPVDLTVSHGDEIVVDLHLPESTPYTSAIGFTFDRSLPGDFAGSRAFPLEGSTPVEAEESREFPATDTGTRARARARRERLVPASGRSFPAHR